MSDFNFPSNLVLHFYIIQAQNTGQNTADHARNVVVYDTFKVLLLCPWHTTLEPTTTTTREQWLMSAFVLSLLVPAELSVVGMHYQIEQKISVAQWRCEVSWWPAISVCSFHVSAELDQ